MEAAGEATRVVVSDGHSYEHLTESISLVKVSGELYLRTAVSLRKVLVDLANQGRCFLVVDMTAVDNIDSVGVGVLIGALKRVRAREGALVLVAPSDSVRKHLWINGLTSRIPVFNTVYAAVEFLGRKEPRAHA
ncbi:STAS domain-containing protein [Streptomyces sp. NPDC127178]|uniref:STAS domain-containing protein n=1 Tax=unclassified Streptomyces TaxID=2593676 RepID=UPI0036272E5A